MEKKYYKHKIENLLVINKIITIHFLELTKNFATPTESHDFWELVCAEKGNIICTAGEKEILLKEGEVLFHKPNEIHSLRADGIHAPNIVVISFECISEAIHFFENRKMTLNKGLLRFIYAIIEESKKTFDIPPFAPELKKMQLLSSPTLGGQQLIKNYLELLLINLMRGESENNNPQAIFLSKDNYEEFISKHVIDYMREHIFENLNVQKICSTLHYNRSYIFKQFKKNTGSSIMAYFNEMKIEKAKELLRETDMSVASISETLSFESPNYFSKLFKKTTGHTPSTYRKIRKR